MKSQCDLDHVTITNTPITEFTEKGIKTADGTEYELDAVVFATGFDAVDGNYTSISIKGKKGETLKQRWADGATSYLGLSIPDFPNLFMILGPNGPFTNLPPKKATAQTSCRAHSPGPRRPFFNRANHKNFLH